jgi:predicted Holliday junction resolvase-like endonuclease
MYVHRTMIALLFATILIISLLLMLLQLQASVNNGPAKALLKRHAAQLTANLLKAEAERKEKEAQEEQRKERMDSLRSHSKINQEIGD